MTSTAPRTELWHDVSLDDNGAAVFTITETIPGWTTRCQQDVAEQTPEERRRYHQTILANLAQSARAEDPW